MANLYGPRIVTDGLVLNLDAGSAKSFDPVNANTELLLHMDGANNSTTFTDSSKNGFTVTPNGNAKISTTQSKFGGSSAYFDGNGDMLSITGDLSKFSFPGDFTVEGWVYLNAYPLNDGVNQNASSFFMSRGESALKSAFQFLYSNHSSAPNHRLGYTMSVGSTDYNLSFDFTSTPSLNTWHHFAFVRNGTSVSAYWNGTKVGQSHTVSGTTNIPTYTPTVGGRGGPYPGIYLNGYIDELRIVKGRALYTSNFTPKRKPYLDGDKIYDLSANGNNGTLTNGPTFSSANMGSLVFDGSNDYNLLPTNFFSYPSLNTFSINLWFKSSQTTGGTLFGQQNTSNPSSTNGYVPVVYLQSNGLIRIEPFWTGSVSNFITSATALNDGTWHHILTTFNVSTNQLYIDGNYVTQRTGLTLVSYTSTYYYIIGAGQSGARGLGTHYFSGNISNFNFYNKVLTTSEIQQNYNATKGRFGL